MEHRMEVEEALQVGTELVGLIEGLRSLVVGEEVVVTLAMQGDSEASLPWV